MPDVGKDHEGENKTARFVRRLGRIGKRQTRGLKWRPRGRSSAAAGHSSNCIIARQLAIRHPKPETRDSTMKGLGERLQWFRDRSPDSGTAWKPERSCIDPGVTGGPSRAFTLSQQLLGYSGAERSISPEFTSLDTSNLYCNILLYGYMLNTLPSIKSQCFYSMARLQPYR